MRNILRLIGLGTLHFTFGLAFVSRRWLSDIGKQTGSMSFTLVADKLWSLINWNNRTANNFTCRLPELCKNMVKLHYDNFGAILKCLLYPKSVSSKTGCIWLTRYMCGPQYMYDLIAQCTHADDYTFLLQVKHTPMELYALKCTLVCLIVCGLSTLSTLSLHGLPHSLQSSLLLTPQPGTECLFKWGEHS